MDDTTRQKVEESPEERKRRIRRQRMIQERRRRRRRKALILRGILVLIFVLLLVGIGSAVSCGCSCGSSRCLRRRLRLSKNTLASITRTKSRGIKSLSNKPPISCTSLICRPQAFPRPPGLPRQSCGASAYLPEYCSGDSNPLRPSGRWPVPLP